LRETGRCFIILPEEIFDLDFPSHYFRRSKSVSITLPCTLHGYRKLQCCDDPPIVSTTADRLERHDSRSGQPIRRLALQPKGRRRIGD